MKKLRFAGALLPLFSCPYTAMADIDTGLKTRGIFGSVGYGYTQDRASDNGTNTLQSSLMQNYMVGKRGAIYSPNLLSYVVQGSLLLNDTESSTGSTMNSTNKNYSINTDFIRATKYPFSLYGEQTTNPYSSVQPGASMVYTQSTDRHGLRGSAELPYFNLNYSAEESNIVQNGSFADENRNNKEYMVSLFRKFDTGTFSAVHTDRSRDYIREDINAQSTLSWNDHIQETRMNANWNVDKTLRVNSYASYMDNTTVDMKNLTGNVNVNWRPSDIYNAGLSLMGSSMSAAGNKSDTLMLSGNSFYQMTPEFSTTQNVSIDRISTQSSEQTMGTVSVGGSYVKTLENNVVLNSSGNVMLKSEQISVAPDVNASIASRDKNTYSYTIAGGASKMMDSIRSTLSGNVSYYDSVSTADDKSRRFMANMMLYSAIRDNLSYTLSGYFIKEESEYFAGSQIGVLHRDSQVITVDNVLRYFQEVGFNGRLSLGGGIAYTNSKTSQSDALTRVYPHLEGSFNYRFFQSLILDSSLSVSQDTASDLTNYSAYMGLNYRLRKIMMLFGTRYMMQSGGNVGERSQNSTFFRVSRSF